MNAYFPREHPLWLYAVAVLAAALLGHLATRIRRNGIARWVAWGVVLGTLVGLDRLTLREPAGLRMLVLITAGLWAFKGLVRVESRRAGNAEPRGMRLLGFTLAWFGMRPKPFAIARGERLEGARGLVLGGVGFLVSGLGLVLGARVVWQHTGSRLYAGALLLPGLSLALHFGVLRIAAGFWRSVGVDVDRLFRAPLTSQNLAEFWGRRWNLAFSELTALAVYRPLTGLIGRSAATVAGFVFSAGLHELAISVPVRGGYGLPSLFFVAHGALVLVERAVAARGRPIQGVFGTAWTTAWLVLPLPILFHRRFFDGVLVPLLQ